MMMTTMRRAWILGAAVLLLPSIATAQAPTKADTPRGEITREGKGSLARADREFVLEAARGGMAEIELGRLAADRASSGAVKQFGQRMATDHQKANDELKALAQQKGLTLPADVGPKHRTLRDRLAKLSGPEFDRAYVDAMVKDHHKDVTGFRREAQRAKDPDLKAWAGKTLPTLEEHFTQIQQIERQLKGRAAR